MEKDRCDFCGKDFLKAMISTTDSTLSRSKGDDAVAGMVSYLEGMQSGVAPLQECRRCGKTYCRTCAQNAGASSGEDSYPCPGCVADHRWKEEASLLRADEKGSDEPRYLSLKEIMAAKKAAAASPTPMADQKQEEPAAVTPPVVRPPQAQLLKEPSLSVNPDEFKRLIEKYLKHEKPLARVQVGDQISSERLEKAKERIAPELGADETPIILFDTSPFSSTLKSGLLATNKALYWRNADKQNQNFSCPYERMRNISTSQLTFMKGRTCDLGFHNFLIIPSEFSLVGDAVISFLQIAAKQIIPLQTEEETERKINDARSVKGQAKALGAIALLLLVLATVAAAVWAFVANPRMLAPIALGIVCWGHSSSKNAFVKLIDFIVWLVLSISMWGWIKGGF